MTKLTKEQVNKRFAGRYVEIQKEYDCSKGFCLYEVIRAYTTIHENTTLGEDVGTAFEYTR